MSAGTTRSTSLRARWPVTASPGRRPAAAVEPRLGRDGAEGGDARRAGVVAVSAPTALAVRTGEAAGITLIGVARADGFEVFTHPERIVPQKVQQHVA